jgi:hypothetical protein
VLPEVVVEFRPRNFGMMAAPEPLSACVPQEPREEGERRVVSPLREDEGKLLRIVSGSDLSDEQRRRILDAERDVALTHRLHTQRRTFRHLYGQVFAHIENYRLKRLRILFRCWSRIYKARTSRREQFEAHMRGACIAANPDLLAQTERRMLDSFSRLAVRRGGPLQASPPRRAINSDGVLESMRPLFELKQEWFQDVSHCACFAFL